METDDKKQLRLEYISPDDLEGMTDNPKIHPNSQIQTIVTSIEEFGFSDPILAIRHEGKNIIVAGHGATAAAKKKGIKEIPVIFLNHLTYGQAIGFNIAHNKIGELSRWDKPKLAKLVGQLLAQKAARIEALGIGKDEQSRLMDIIDRKAGKTDEDYVPVFKETEIKLGDMFELGQHRVLCGDSTEDATFKKLLGTMKADMTFTDPPYNVALNQEETPHNIPPEYAKPVILGDDMPRKLFREFLGKLVKNILDFTDGAVYICMGCKEWAVLMDEFEKAGGYWSSTIIWAKNHFVMGRSDYHRRFEPLLYGWKDGLDMDAEKYRIIASCGGPQGYQSDYDIVLYGWKDKEQHYFSGARNQSDVWEIAKRQKNPLHPTMKPVELCRRAIMNSSVRGDIVLEPFGGSGSTLIAAEQVDRKCYLIELDPNYCQVIIDRWEEYTGETAFKLK